MPSNSQRCRSFNFGDMMILVAATAIGLRGLIFYHVSISALVNIPTIAAFAMPLLVGWTLGFLAIRLRKPRPKRRRLMRQPGVVACTTVVLHEALILPLVVPLEILNRHMWPIGGFHGTSYTLMSLLPWSGLSVLVSWGLFVAAGHLRKEPGWIDWFGILLGIGWSLETLVAFYEQF